MFEGEGGEVWINDQIVGETFMDGFDDLVVISFGKAFERGLLDYIAKV